MEQRITSPDSPNLHHLVSQLRQWTEQLDYEQAWPLRQLQACGEFGVFEWFADFEWGGQKWGELDLVRGYLALGRSCLTTTFILTQRTAAYQRIERSENTDLKRRLLPDLVSGRSFATVGISHLTTSRQHLRLPPLQAERSGEGFVLNGYTPWVTGALHAQHIVVGATMPDQRQLLLAVPTSLPGVSIQPPEPLVGLAASHTGKVNFDSVHVGSEWVLAGPVDEVMKQGVGARTGGLQTSTLALALAQTAIDFLRSESVSRETLAIPAQALLEEWSAVQAQLFASATNAPVCTDAELRARSNSLVLRATQAALAAAKGAGYVMGHPAGRWCREALFFLVWSCPQPVVNANLCEFAGIQL